METADVLKELYGVVSDRKENYEEGSYTCYLFSKGLDKILKKCGEECSEMIIAAKNADNAELAEEICDLLYHMLVLMAECDLPLSEVEEILRRRSLKIGNLKQMRDTDRET